MLAGLEGRAGGVCWGFVPAAGITTLQRPLRASLMAESTLTVLLGVVLCSECDRGTCRCRAAAAQIE